LGTLRSAYWGWHVTLLLDEDPSHTAQASLRAAAGMTLLWLPKRSPELNPMDTLWGQGKDVISANKQNRTIEEQVKRFVDYLSSLSAEERFIRSVSSPMTVGSNGHCQKVLRTC
jgi:hypothetical protein